jgi:transcription-repair coupling factor (superfamily II helicase)
LECPLWHYPAANRSIVTEPFVAPDIQGQRLAVLYAAAASNQAKIIVTSAQAIMEKVPPKGQCMDASRYLVKGEEVHHEQFISHLSSIGYDRTDLVEEIGDFSVRGDIVDLFCPFYHGPLRLEFFDETLESIRFFNPSTQRSSDLLKD